jgi:hypothetical protein
MLEITFSAKPRSLQIRLSIPKPRQGGTGSHFQPTLFGLLVGADLAIFQRSWFELGLFISGWAIGHKANVPCPHDPREQELRQ